MDKNDRNDSVDKSTQKELSADDLLQKLKKDIKKYDNKSSEDSNIKSDKNIIPDKKNNDLLNEKKSKDISIKKVDDPLEGLDIDELIKKYMPESDQKFMQPIESDLEKINKDTVNEEETDEKFIEEYPFENIDDSSENTEEINENDISDSNKTVLKTFKDSHINPPETIIEQDDNSQSRYKVKSKVSKKELTQTIKTQTDIENKKNLNQNDKTNKKNKKSKKSKDDFYQKTNEVDDTDVKIMMAFGMEDELSKTVGFDKITEVEKEINETDYEKQINKKEKKPEKIVEYKTLSQTEGIVLEYKKRYSKILIKLLICTVLFIITFLYENINLFGGTLPSPVNPLIYSFVHVMINLQFLFIGAALIYKQAVKGLKDLFKLKPDVESFSALLIIFSFLYIISSFFAEGKTIKLFTFAVVFCVFVVLLGEFFNTRREIYSFNIVASKRPKHMIVKLSEEESAPEKEILNEYIPQNPNIFKIEKAAFTDGFFGRMKAPSQTKNTALILIPLLLIIMLVFFAVELFITKNIFDSLKLSYISLLISMPVSIIFTYSYPFYKASKEAYGIESAIIGENSINEYSKANAVSFDDKEVFPSYGVKVKNMKVYGNNRIDYIIFSLASLFIKIGGPLADVFEVATNDLDHSENIDIIEIASNGIEAMIDEKHVYIGKAQYIKSKGIYLPRESNTEELPGEMSVMYMVYEYQLAAKIDVQYIIDPDFEPLLAQLQKIGVCVSIKTFDPNIDDQMLSSRIKISKYPVKVLKLKTLNKNEGIKQSLDSGIVSKNSAKALLQTLSLCGRVINVIRNNTVVKAFSIFVGLILTTMIITLNILPMVASLYIVLYQIFWLIPIIIITDICIGKI